MGFWSFFRRRSSDAPPPTEPTAQAGQQGAGNEPPNDLATLLRAGEPDGPSEEESLGAFRALRSTTAEARAVDELARVALQRPLGESLLLALANTLVDRGENAMAARVLKPASTSAALLLQADLAERRNELPTALSLIERVLLRDFDHPGARERHRRWRSQLGFAVEHKPVAPGATVVARDADAPFDLLREVGRGGAAAVYEAVDRELGRHVALKVYHQPERDRVQLRHEARVAVALAGPGVVRVFDLDPDHGWLALGWAQKGTLRDKIRAREADQLLPLARWAVPLAQALARVHASGWVHHDVKPANVLLDARGNAILTDFGIARRASEPTPPGSLGYISPERMKGRASDPRDDVYGFGRILEDVLDLVKDHEIVARARPLAAACTGPDEHRPSDGRALLTRLRVELSTLQ